MKLRSLPAFGRNIVQKSGVERSDVIHLFDDQVINDDPTTVNSQVDGSFAAILPSGSWDEYELFLDIDSTLFPTDISFFVEFSPDGGTTWFHNAQGVFASLVFDDSVTASGLKQVFRGEVAGPEMRLRVVGALTNATNFFTFSAFIQFKRK